MMNLITGLDAARAERMNRLLAVTDLQWLNSSEQPTPQLVDREGASMSIAPNIVTVLDAIDDTRVAPFLSELWETVTRAESRAFTHGQSVGKKMCMREFHEFLGVTELRKSISDSIMEAAQVIADTMRNTR
jgi:hypothetical protein